MSMTPERLMEIKRIAEDWPSTADYFGTAELLKVLEDELEESRRLRLANEKLDALYCERTISLRALEAEVEKLKKDNAQRVEVLRDLASRACSCFPEPGHTCFVCRARRVLEGGA